MKNIDPRVRTLYYILLGKPVLHDSDSRKYLSEMLDRVNRKRGSVFRDCTGRRHTRTQEIVEEIIKELKEEESNEVG